MRGREDAPNVPTILFSYSRLDGDATVGVVEDFSRTARVLTIAHGYKAESVNRRGAGSVLGSTGTIGAYGERGKRRAHGCHHGPLNDEKGV
jgi:hypothetical protein